jgi:hypothetical protein
MSKSIYYVVADDMRTEKIEVKKSRAKGLTEAQYFYPNNNKGTYVSIDENGNCHMILDDQEPIKVPMFVLSELANIKRAFDDKDKFMFGGKDELYQKQVD